MQMSNHALSIQIKVLGHQYLWVIILFPPTTEKRQFILPNWLLITIFLDIFWEIMLPL